VRNGLIHERMRAKAYVRGVCKRGDNLPHETTTRKMLMCLNCCTSSLATLCSYRVHSPTSVHITPAQYNTLPNRNDVEINKYFAFHISLNWFLLPVRSIYVTQNLMVQLPVFGMFSVKKLGVPLTYTRAMLLCCTCKCLSCLSYCRHMTDFRQPNRGQGGHCRK